MTIRTTIEVTCDGRCGTTATMDGSVAQPFRELSDVGWTFPVNKPVHGETVQKHYCPVCTRARLVGTV